MGELSSMKIGDRFFTIAYSVNTRVIEVEVIDIDILDGITYVHTQNVDNTIDKWDMPIERVMKLKFNTRVDAEKKLSERGFEIDNEVMQKYKNLLIPQDKIDIEINRTRHSVGFPFFLRKVSDGKIEAVTMTDYPKGVYAIVYSPYSNRQADKAIHNEITVEYIGQLLKEGFKWFHESEMDTLW